MKPSILFCLIAIVFSGCASSPIPAQSSIPRTSAFALAQAAAAPVNGEVVVVADTGSMEPTLSGKSIVAIEHVSFTSLRQGDIVIYRDAGGLRIVHRLIKRSGNAWFVKGDDNATKDCELVTASNLVGRVFAIFYASS
jgi:signal peptidase I